MLTYLQQLDEKARCKEGGREREGDVDEDLDKDKDVDSQNIEVQNPEHMGKKT